MSFAAAVDHLHALGLELAPADNSPRRKFDLEHMRILATALGDPQKHFPAILIAGTNGKGSTAATLASILAAAGYHTGLYTSPHLSRVTERIRTSDPLNVLSFRTLSDQSESKESAFPHPNQPAPFTEIPEDTFARLYFQVDSAARELVSTGQLPHHPSFFESLTALAFLYFAEQKLDIAILEVGLGGRLDATNIVDPILSVITDIALDHQEYLGNTITEIAREKAGILRLNGTLITLPQHPEANQAIGETAIALNVRGINAADYLPSRSALPDRSEKSTLRSSSGLQPETAIALNVRDINAPGYLPHRTAPPDPSEKSALRSSSGLQPETAIALNVRDINAPGYLPHRTAPPDPSEKSALRSSSGLQPAVDQAGTWGALAPELTRPTTPLTPNHYDLILNNELLQVRSPLAGQHQQRNIALAIAAAVELRNGPPPVVILSAAENPRILPVAPQTDSRNQTSYISPPTPYNIPNSAIEAGIANTSWPGRLEFLPPNLILDVAHNPAGAWTLRAAIATLPEDQPRTLIFSCLRDKDLTEMAQILFPLFDSSVPPLSSSRSAAQGSASPSNLKPRTLHPIHHIVLAPINNPRAASLDDLLAAARALDVPAHAAHDPTEALALARSLTPADGLILATGSIYLIGALREAAVAPESGCP